MARERYTPRKTVPLRGGIVTVRHKALVPFGGFSAAQNVRPKRPGFIKRPGQIALHTTADGSNSVMTMYQFKKQKVTEQHFYGQFSDSDVLEATSNPPTVTTGVFGSEVFSGVASPKPATWAVVRDQLVFANGVDEHQIYGGNSSFIDACVVFKDTSAAPDIPEEGEDYSEQVKSSDTSKVVTVSAVGTNANNFIAFMTPMPCKSFTVDVATVNAGGADLANIEYGKNDNTWANVSGLSDGTASGGSSLAQDGTISFTAPTDIQPRFMYGRNGYWYRLKFNAALDSPTTINTVTFDTDWQDMINKWDGAATDPVEIWVNMTAADEWSRYSSASVDVGDLPASRKLLLFCTDPIEAIYCDVGATPNSVGGAISTIKYWDGDSFESVGTFTDGTSAFMNSGWITFPRKTAHPHQFESAIYYAYVYEITMDANALSADMDIAFMVRPYFDLTELGVGNTSCAWKNRMAHTFSEYPQFVFITAKGDPQILNGSTMGLIEAGDGRHNAVVASDRFHQELIVWQEEKGVEGGCTTLIQGYSAGTFGKYIISTKIGTMNSKSTAVVDGIAVATSTEEQIKTLAFWLSRYGVCASDGRVIWIISDDVQDYFQRSSDKTANAIRSGYEDKMWMGYDSKFNVLICGLVTGTTATDVNTYLLYDLTDHVWYTDTREQEINCMAEVEASSGDEIILQVGGGQGDGLVYLLNSGQNDVSTAVDSQLTLELDGQGEIMNLHELIFRCEAQTAGDITLNITANSINKVSNKTLSMIAQVANQTIRRHRMNLNVVDGHISITLQHNTVSQDMNLFDIGARTSIWKER